MHLELRTANAARACAFFRQLFGWRAETVHLGRSCYISLALRAVIDGGVVEEERALPFWLPYVEVADAGDATRRAELLGGRVLLEPREGPMGWRGVIVAPDGTEVALWQPKPAGGSAPLEPER